MGRPKDEHKAELIKEAAVAGISERTVERQLARRRKTKPRRAKPPEDKLSPEHIWKRFCMFLKYWPSPAHQRTVREYLKKKLA